MDQSDLLRVSGYGWWPDGLGRIAGYRAALSAIRYENAEQVYTKWPIRMETIDFLGTCSQSQDSDQGAEYAVKMNYYISY